MCTRAAAFTFARRAPQFKLLNSYGYVRASQPLHLRAARRNSTIEFLRLDRSTTRAVQEFNRITRQQMRQQILHELNRVENPLFDLIT
ncbi:hypothetical protein L2E82_00140 [Cichorium intybus]|uniref:Uncharacterized protein n=1 Tax=Cichorium intybus TaxID=13427 RepID=A0ACB9GXJ4_CICIN|nr:hypothetical protein L2E82_00140 [Cichorium intybus]